jgi:hypothetical protein
MQTTTITAPRAPAGASRPAFGLGQAIKPVYVRATSPLPLRNNGEQARPETQLEFQTGSVIVKPIRRCYHARGPYGA